MRLLRACLVLLLPLTVRAQVAGPRPITIGVIDSIWSPALKEFRRVHVSTPPAYRQSPYLQRAYPVLYLLDGDAHFHSVTGLLQILGTGVNGTFVVPEMIVVAIPNTDRTRDLTPTRSLKGPTGQPMPATTSGGNPSFFQFLKSELMPWVDSTYRTEPYRVLVGHSFGGITALNALYIMPETFNAYVAIDPSLWWDDQLLLKRATEYFATAAPAGRALYVAQANTKNPADPNPNVHFNAISEFNRVLESGNRSGIRYAFKYYDADDHGSVPLIAEYDALRFIFDGYKLDALKALDRPAFVTEHFANVSAKLGYRVPPPERMVDQLGQGVLGRDTTKALAFMQLNAELYPKSPRAHMAFGNVLLLKRDSARARAAYARVVELAPQDERAKEALLKLTRKE